MSYTPTEWQTGDTITAEKLNNMEQGIENASKSFIVTLTPTAQDFSGTMDKTVAEINAAYEAGKDILFRVLTSANSYVDVPMSYAGRDTTLQYPNFVAEVIQTPTDLMIVAYTEDTNDGTKQTYRTIIYTLTRMT
jgi:hypothetical protein